MASLKAMLILVLFVIEGTSSIELLYQSSCNNKIVYNEKFIFVVVICIHVHKNPGGKCKWPSSRWTHHGEEKSDE